MAVTNLSNNFTIYVPDETKPLVAPDEAGVSIAIEDYVDYVRARRIDPQYDLITGDKIWAKVGTIGKTINGVPFAKYTDWQESTALLANGKQFRITVDLATALITNQIEGISVIFKNAVDAPNSATRTVRVKIPKENARNNTLPAEVEIVINKRIGGYSNAQSGSLPLTESSITTNLIQYSPMALTLDCGLADDGSSIDMQTQNHAVNSDGVGVTFVSGKTVNYKFSFMPRSTLALNFVNGYFLGMEEENQGVFSLINENERRFCSIDSDNDFHLRAIGGGQNRLFVPCVSMQSTDNAMFGKKITSQDAITVTLATEFTTFSHALVEFES